MAKKNSKVSINALERAANISYDISPVDIQFGDLTITVKPRLAFSEVMSLVGLISETCFFEDDDYRPEVYDLAMRRYVLETYTNLTLPSNMEHAYDLVMYGGIFEAVLENIDREQFDGILRFVDERIRYLRQMHIQAAQEKTNKLLAEVENLVNQIKSAFGDIQKDDMKNILQAIANGKLDEKKLVDAYFANKKADDE